MSKIRNAKQHEFDWVNQRYAEVDFVPSTWSTDIVAIAEADGQRIGLGRLVSMDDRTLELGGMYVFDSYRGKGIAKKIVSFLLNHVSPSHTVYCIPFENLCSLYEACGFVKCGADHPLPVKLHTKYQWCRDKYPRPVALMKAERPIESLLTIAETEPDNFQATLNVAAVYIEVDGRFLVLQRAANKSEGRTWGMPAGKIDPNESPEDAAYRELLEETGIRLEPEQPLEFRRTLYGLKLGFQFAYHMYGTQLSEFPPVSISDEHLAYKWATLDEIRELDFMGGALEALEIYLRQ